MTITIAELPPEIQCHILSYTYSPQPPALLADIRHFFTTKAAAHTYYYHRYIVYWREPEPEDKHWLMCDLYAFAHSPKIRKTAHTPFAVRLANRNLQSRINVIWGWLTPYQREIFLIFLGNNHIRDSP